LARRAKSSPPRRSPEVNLDILLPSVHGAGLAGTASSAGPKERTRVVAVPRVRSSGGGCDLRVPVASAAGRGGSCEDHRPVPAADPGPRYPPQDREAPLMGRDLAIDLGTGNTIVFVSGRGVVLKDPTSMASNRQDGSWLAMGREA